MNERRLAILAEGSLEFHYGKTAVSIVRYRPDEVVAVIDSDNAGRTTAEVLGLGGDIPIVADVEAAFAHNPTTLLIGIAPRGGELPLAWRQQIATAISHGLDVVSGLHSMLGDDPEFAQLAARFGVQIIDERRSPGGLRTTEMTPRRPGSHVITFVGSDCAVGKMTAALEIRAEARRQGLSAAFVATGQTGIMLEGTGIAIDRVVGDFMAGATESLVVDASREADWVFVEGQGSLLHPAYSGVTLALLHGSGPDAMVLVHSPGHDQIDNYPVSIPPLPTLIRIYESAASWVRPARVVAIALNTRGLSPAEYAEAVAAAEAATGLPTADPVRGGATKLVRGIVASLSTTPAEGAGVTAR